MEFGIYTRFNTWGEQPESKAFDEWMDLATFAEDIGIDCFWLGEFHFQSNSLLSSPLTVASAISARTKRMRIGIGIQLLPVAHPIRIAEEAAIVDHVSKGRLILGVGRSSFTDAYRGFSVDYEESRPRFSETLEIMLKAWSNESFSYHGRYFQIPEISVEPKPFRKPHPSVHVACQSDDSFVLMARWGFPILIRQTYHDMDQMRDLVAQHNAARREAGFADPQEMTLSIACHLDESAEKVRLAVEPGMLADRLRLEEKRRVSLADEKLQVESGYDDFIQRNLLGSPEEVVERLREYQERLGITGVSLNINPGLGLRPEAMKSSLRLLVDRVMPHFK